VTQAVFREKAPGIMRLLMADFDLSVEDAAAIMGNLGHESGGLTSFQEVNPTVPGSAGGWGWAQWTGPRRRSFESYCARNNLDPKSDKANYGWLFVELKGTEKAAIPAVKSAKDLKAKVIAFENAFERAGVKHYDSRLVWAQRAMAAYGAEQPVPDVPDVPAPTPDTDPAIAVTEQEMVAMIQILLPMLIPIIQKAVESAISRPDVPLQSPAPTVAASAVTDDVLRKVEDAITKTPELQHVANAEAHWWQKRSRWASILGIVSAGLQFAGLTEAVPVIQGISPETFVNIGSGITALWSAYLAYRAGTATRPLGA